MHICQHMCRYVLFGNVVFLFGCICLSLGLVCLVIADGLIDSTVLGLDNLETTTVCLHMYAFTKPTYPYFVSSLSAFLLA